MFGFVSRLFRRAPAGDATWIDAVELRRRQQSGQSVLLIDVRQPEEFAAPPGHLPDAVNIPLPDLEGRITEVAGHDRPIVVVCKTDRRSARAAEMLRASGLKDIAVLRGGTDGWHQLGLPLH